MNKKKKGILLALPTLLLCVLLFCERLTGEIIHALLGLVLVLVMMVHMVKNHKKMKYMPAAVRLVDQVLLCAMLVMLATGVLLHPLGAFFILKILHKLSAVIFVLGCIAHILQRRKSVKKQMSMYTADNSEKAA